MKRQHPRHHSRRRPAPDYQDARIQLGGVEVNGHRLELPDEPERTSGRLPCACGYYAWRMRTFMRHLVLVEKGLWLGSHERGVS